jgi:WD40 repeat protein
VYSPQHNTLSRISQFHAWTSPFSGSIPPQIVVYDGATGQSVGEVVDAHAGSIYSVAFAPDGARFATASADKTVKVCELWATTD